MLKQDLFSAFKLLQNNTNGYIKVLAILSNK